jgi:hypothetical protein
LAKAMMRVMIGRVNPMAVKAKVAPSDILPMYILSTTLYKTLINWAKVMGKARFKIFLTTLPWVKSFFKVILLSIYNAQIKFTLHDSYFLIIPFIKRGFQVYIGNQCIKIYVMITNRNGTAIKTTGFYCSFILFRASNILIQVFITEI